MREVALVLGLGDAYDHGVARGVARVAAARGWRVHGWGWMFRPLPRLGSWRGDGVIARVTGTAEARRLAALGVPVVDVAGAVDGWGFHQVTNDDSATGQVAGRELARSGFRSAAYAGVAGVQWSAARQQGFHVGFGSSAMPALRRALPWWRRQDTARTLVPWLRRQPRPLALFASHDIAGLRCLEACQAAGLRVPQDVAVLGVDDERIACELAVPTLSSIPPDCDAIGVRAAEVLAAVLARTPRAPVVARLPPREPVWRASTATVVVQDPLVVACLARLHDPAWLPRGITALAQDLGVARRTLEVHMRAAFGESILSRWTRVRLAVARQHLESGATITAAARRAGWADARSLAVVVRRLHQQTVGTWAGLARRASAGDGGDAISGTARSPAR